MKISPIHKSFLVKLLLLAALGITFLAFSQSVQANQPSAPPTPGAGSRASQVIRPPMPTGSQIHHLTLPAASKIIHLQLPGPAQVQHPTMPGAAQIQHPTVPGASPLQQPAAPGGNP